MTPLATKQVPEISSSLWGVCRGLWFVALVFYLLSPLEVSEYFWSLTLGSWVARTQSTVEANHWTVFGQGSFLDLNWVFNLSLSKLETNFGSWGPFLSKPLLALLLLLSLFRACQRRSGEFFFSTATVTILACAILPYLSLSPDLLGLLLFVVGIEIFSWAFSAPALSFRCAPLAFLLGMLCLSLHPSPIAALLLCLFSTRGQARHQCASILCATSMFAAGLACSPYRGEQFGELLRRVSSFLAANMFSLSQVNTIYSFPLCFLILLLGKHLLLIYTGPNKASPVAMLRIALLLVLGFASREFLPYLLIVAALDLAEFYRQDPAVRSTNLAQFFGFLGTTLTRLPATGAVWLLLCLSFVNVAKYLRYRDVSAHLPRAEIDFILDNKLPGPLFHSPESGSYLLWRLSFLSQGKALEALVTPELRHIPDVASALQNCELATKLIPPGIQFFNSLAPQTALVRVADPLYVWLSEHREWHLVFQGGRAVDQRANSQEERKIEALWAVFQRT